MGRPFSPRLLWVLAALMLLLLPSPAATARGPGVVQQIGDLGGRISEAVASAAVAAGVRVVPFSPRRDPRATPIILAPGTAFVKRGGKHVGGLQQAERAAIRQAYAAGQVILLLDASTHDIEALHRLLDDGVALQSTTHPTVLAYALRQENKIPKARLVADPLGDSLEASDGSEDDLSRSLDVVIEEMTRPPAVPTPSPRSTNWGDSPVQSTILTSTTNGTYNTPVEVYALHSCQRNMDYYLVNTGGTWTPMEARYESASVRDGQISTDAQGNLHVNWQGNDSHCTGGIEVALGPNPDERICRYMNYPLFYEIDIVPPSGPKVVQVNAAPAGDQGLSASYTSGFSFSIGGGVDVSGDGPSGGIQAGVSWDNSVSTTVPALAIQAGNKGNQGTFTKYLYCTVGDRVQDCTPTIQMGGESGLCRQFVVGRPQNGQTPNGRLSNVAQTVNWQVDPATYTAGTFDVTVTFQVDLATSTSLLWTGWFLNHPNDKKFGPDGYCNAFGCSCGINTQSTPVTLSYTFKVPFPSRQCAS